MSNRSGPNIDRNETIIQYLILLCISGDSACTQFIIKCPYYFCFNNFFITLLSYRILYLLFKLSHLYIYSIPVSPSSTFFYNSFSVHYLNMTQQFCWKNNIATFGWKRGFGEPPDRGQGIYTYHPDFSNRHTAYFDVLV